MDKKLNILIYPSGGENALEVREALSYKVNIQIFGASSKDDHSKYVYKNFFICPNVNDDNFLMRFNELLERYQINVIIPCHDTVALKLSEWRDQINATIITSDYETNKKCRYKILTYKALSSFSFIPKIYSKIKEIKEYPVFIKPNEGAGGKGTFVAYKCEEVQKFLDLHNENDYIIVEFLPGKEYTVDCFTDKNRNLRYVGARERRRIWGGISTRATSVTDNKFIDIAESINYTMKFRGYWFYQVKEDSSGNLKLLEVATRPAGTMCLYRQRGINFMLLSIYDFLGYDYEMIDNGYSVELDRCLFARYTFDYNYDSIYLDFDDTLIFNGKVNKYCLLLLYQAKEKGISVILLTKSVANVYDKLNHYHIPTTIFSKIEAINENENKADYIRHKRPIFIDNSFEERYKVKLKLNIPVLDTDNIPLLLDWRE